MLVFACLLLLVPSTSRDASAADKSAVACIQAAEDGQTANKKGELLHARELFAQCAARECPAMLRRDCAAWLEDAEKQIPSIVLGAHDGEGHDLVDARASIDGTRVRDHLDGSPITLDPGSHVVRFERDGIAPVDVRVVLRAGEKNRAVMATVAAPVSGPAEATQGGAPAQTRMQAPGAALTLVPLPATEGSRHAPTGAWVLGGIGIVGLGVFGLFGLIGTNDANGLRVTCAPGCSDSQVLGVRYKLIAADVGLGVGVISLAAGVWIGVRGLTTGAGKSAGSRTAGGEGWEVGVVPVEGGAAVRLRF